MNAVLSRKMRGNVLVLNVAFWLALILLISLGIGQREVPERSLFVIFWQTAIGMLLLIIPVAYFNTQWLIPRYLAKKKYWQYALFTLLFCLVWPPIPVFLDNLVDKHLFHFPPEELDDPLDLVGSYVTLLVMVISTMVNLMYRWLLEQGHLGKIENERLSVELSMLRNQISPHFFFNTLNNLYALALEESKETPAMILKLSEMMRYTLYDCDGTHVKLTSEVKYLENYIDLQLIRHRHQVDVQFDYEQDDPEQEICPLVLIVFLENAFKHGVEGLEEGANVHMKLEAKDGNIHFQIENREAPVRSLESSSGIGLKNAMKRLDLVYGERCTLETRSEDGKFLLSLNIRTHAA